MTSTSLWVKHQFFTRKHLSRRALTSLNKGKTGHVLDLITLKTVIKRLQFMSVFRYVYTAVLRGMSSVDAVCTTLLHGLTVIQKD